MFSKMLLRRPDGTRYLERLRLVNTPWFRVFLHRIDSPDPGMDLHDHPWECLRIGLRGSYTEAIAPTREAHHYAGRVEPFPEFHNKGPVTFVPVRYGPRGADYRECEPGRFALIRRTQAHSIVRVHSPVITLFITWGRRRPWGFYTPDGWVDFEHYPHERRGNDLIVEGVARTKWD